MEKSILSILAGLFAIGVVINLVVLNYTLFRLVPIRFEQVAVSTDPSPSSPPDLPQDRCGIDCKLAIAASVKELESKIATLAARPLPTSTPRPASTATPLAGVKEFFVPMGTGSTTKADWEDIPGTDVYINTENYPHIQTVYFEVSLRIPTKNGVVSARLYNVTDKHPVWNSEVSTDQDASTFKASTFTLDPGNKQYRVQMKTTLQYQSLLDSARIKILTR